MGLDIVIGEEVLAVHANLVGSLVIEVGTVEAEQDRNARNGN